MLRQEIIRNCFRFWKTHMLQVSDACFSLPKAPLLGSFTLTQHKHERFLGALLLERRSDHRQLTLTRVQLGNLGQPALSFDLQSGGLHVFKAEILSVPVAALLLCSHYAALISCRFTGASLCFTGFFHWDWETPLRGTQRSRKAVTLSSSSLTLELREGFELGRGWPLYAEKQSRLPSGKEQVHA